MVEATALVQHKRANMMKPFTLIRDRLSGFTVIELMMTMVVLGVIVTLAVPSFNDFVLKTRVNSAATEIQMSLLLARSEAVKRNTTVSITPANTAAWTQGWNVTYVDGGGTTRTLKAQAAYTGAMTVTGPAAAVAYGRDGRLTGTTAVTFTVNVPGNANITTKTVAVDVSGRANVH
jgi:type IV fimbrial biogenesis protein FimT